MFVEYSAQLKKEFNLLGVQKATWIKTKYVITTPLVNLRRNRTTEKTNTYLDSKQKLKSTKTTKNH